MVPSCCRKCERLEMLLPRCRAVSGSVMFLVRFSSIYRTAARWEVHDDKIKSASLTWLKACTVEHNEMLRKIAEERFHADFNQE